jgi:hypothetical protein
VAEERKLSKDEERRSKLFAEVSSRLNAEGYSELELTTTAAMGNILGTGIGCLFAAPFIVVFALLNGFFRENEPNHPGVFLLCLFIFLVSIVVHELIHGFTWGIFAPNHFKSVAFGVIWQALTPYCSCKEALKPAHYIAGLLMPCIALGVVPAVIAIITANSLIMMYAALMIICAGGDLFILCLIIKKKPRKKDILFLDHPTAIGLVCFVK